jgi:hypothetical protein
MCGAADEVDAVIAQDLERAIDRIDQLERHIEPFGLEEAEFHRRRRGKIRVGNHVRDGNFHSRLL